MSSGSLKGVHADVCHFLGKSGVMVLGCKAEDILGKKQGRLLDYHSMSGFYYYGNYCCHNSELLTHLE